MTRLGGDSGGTAEGQTPLDGEEEEGLIPGHIGTRAQLDEWEQANIAEALPWLDRRRPVEAILTAAFLRQLHRRMFGKTWRWAGSFRTTGKTIGVPANQIAEAIHNLLENAKLQVQRRDLSLDLIAVRFHHELVRIHPFANGNGRHARQATDLLVRALGQPPFTWGSANLNQAGGARSAYITALRSADQGNLDRLIAFVRS